VSFCTPLYIANLCFVATFLVALKALLGLITAKY